MKNVRKLVSLLLISALLLMALPGGTLSGSAASQTTVPTGYTPIYTAAELDAVRNAPSGNYILMNDIVFMPEDFEEGGAFYNDGAGWIAIPEFRGVFDGNGYRIANLQCYSEGDYRQDKNTTTFAGLFGKNEGRICDLGVETSYMVSVRQGCASNLGSVVGYNAKDAVIERCYSTSSLVAMSDLEAFGGGIAGINDGIIRQCYFSGSAAAISIGEESYVSAAYAGGITGENRNWRNCQASITDCFNAGQIFAVSVYTGTLATPPTMPTCSGGIAGCSYNPITNCYNVGHLFASSSSSDPYSAQIGGVVGKDAQRVTNSCYADYIETLHHDQTYDKSPAYSVKDMQKQSTFEGYDFSSVWTMAGHPDYVYPELAGMPVRLVSDMLAARITREPDKTTYIESDGVTELDLTGGEITAYYANGTSETVPFEEFAEATSFDGSVIGEQEIPLIYEMFLMSFTVEVVEKDISGVTVKSYPTVTTVYQGTDELQTTGGVLTIAYNNGTTETKTITPVMVYGFDGERLGEQTVTIEYLGYEFDYKIKVIENPVVSLRIGTRPNKLTYNVGEQLDTTGLSVTAILEDGSRLQVEDFEISCDMHSPGTKTVTVSYEDVSTTFEITVVGSPSAGDVNLDGKVTITDMLSVKSHILGKSKLTGTAAQNADTNGDGNITITDFIQIKSHLLGKSKLN